MVGIEEIEIVVVIVEPMIGDPLPVLCLQQEMIDEMIAAAAAAAEVIGLQQEMIDKMIVEEVIEVVTIGVLVQLEEEIEVVTIGVLVHQEEVILLEEMIVVEVIAIFEAEPLQKEEFSFQISHMK